MTFIGAVRVLNFEQPLYTTKTANPDRVTAPSVPAFVNPYTIKTAIHPRPYVGVSQSQFFRDLVNFWR